MIVKRVLPTNAVFEERLYWLEAMYNDVATQWGDHARYGTDAHIEDLAYYAAITSFCGDDRRDTRSRRRLLFYFLSTGMDAQDPGDLLRMYSPVLPTDSWIPRVLNTICNVYSYGVERKMGAATDPHAAAYARFGMDGRLQEAHRQAKLCSGCLVGPYVSGKGRFAQPKVHVLAPDMFRAEVDPLDSDRIVEVAIPTMLFNRDTKRMEVHFQIWHDDTLHVENMNGEQVSFFPDDESTTLVNQLPNRYGRIPYELLRLTEPASDVLLSGGMFPVVEANIACNAITVMADHNMMYNGFAQWVAYNLDWVNNRAKLGPASMLALEKVEGGSETGMAEGRLDVVAPPSQYEGLDQQKRNRKREVLRDLDIPESLISDNPGIPPSGIARLIERLGLIGQRKNDILAITPFERRLLPLAREVWNQDYRGGEGYKTLSEADVEEIVFHDEPIYGDPAQEKRGKVFEVQVSFAEGKVTREMAVSHATIVLGFTQEEADALFPAPPEVAGEDAPTDATIGTGLRGSVGGSAQIAALQASYYKGEIVREALIANAMLVFGFARPDAEALFPIIEPKAPGDDAMPAGASDMPV